MSVAFHFGMRRSYVVMLGAVYLLVMTFAWATPGEGKVTNLAPFERIQVSGSVDVVISQSADRSVRLEGAPGSIDVESVDGTLYIEADDATLRPQVQVAMQGIKELVVVGVADVTLTGFSGDTIVFDGENSGRGIGHIQANRIRFDHVIVTSSGQFDFDLHGRATHQDVFIEGRGRYAAEGLLSQTSVVEVAGEGVVNLWTEQFIDLHAEGAAQVTYRGSPWVNKQVSGKANVHARYPETSSARPVHQYPVTRAARAYTTRL